MLLLHTVCGRFKVAQRLARAAGGISIGTSGAERLRRRCRGIGASAGAQDSCLPRAVRRGRGALGFGTECGAAASGGWIVDGGEGMN